MNIQKPILLSLALASALGAGCATTLGDKEIVRGSDQFEFTYRVKLPEMMNAAQLWLPLARSDAFQTVKVVGISTAMKYQQVNDRDYGNQILILSPGARDSGKTIEVKYTVRRTEKSAYASADKDAMRFLKPERLVPLNKTFKSIADEATAGRQTAMDKARALYDHTLGQMKYDKSGTGWGKGDAMYACDAKTGNCTDFHAYFIALARSVGVPARFAIGYTIPADKDEGAIAGYHCWAEFLADGKWVPVDISEASKQPALAEYYFGHHPANRFEFTQGRDLVVEPASANGPLNFLVYPLLEVAGKVVKTENEFSFKRVKAKL